jgi:hypothetical protein
MADAWKQKLTCNPLTARGDGCTRALKPKRPDYTKAERFQYYLAEGNAWPGQELVT